MLTFVRLALRNIFRNRGRTFITIAAVALAVLLALTMRSMQYGAYGNMIKNVVGFYTGYAKVNAKGFWEEKSLDLALLDEPSVREKILAHPNVIDLVPRLETGALAASEDVTKGSIVTGIDIEKEKYIVDVENKMQTGKYFSSNNEQSVIISEGLAKFLKLGVGDTLVLLSQGFRATSASGKYPVIGTMRFGSPDLNGNMVFLPIETAQYMYAAEERLTSIVPIMSNIRKLDQTVMDLKSSLGEEYEVLGWNEMIPELVQLIEADNKGGMIFLSILYIIISFGIFGTILMMTTERLYEFAVLISIGMKRLKLMIVVFLEALFINFLGVIAGCIIGVPVLVYFYFNPIHLGEDLSDLSEQYNIEPVLNFSLNPEIFYSQAILVFIIAVLVTLYPVWKIKTLDLINALRG